MRIGVISDVHANRVALEAVFADMPAVDALVCAGDVVGYYPWPGDCVDALRGRPAALGAPHPTGDAVPTVLGNHDRMVVEGRNFRGNEMARAGVRHARETLSEEQSGWLGALPTERTAFDGRFRIVHGHPLDPDRYTYPEEFGPDLLDEEDVLVLGHTHVQSHARYEEGVVLNPGSVGQPRDRDPKAAYAVVDLASLGVEERRVEYDVTAVEEGVRAAGLPERVARRLREGR